MCRMKSKIIILLAAGILAWCPSFGQVRTEISIHEKSNSSDDETDRDLNHGTDFSAGFGIGSTKMFGDLPLSNPQPAYIGYLEKNITQSISWGEVIMIGDLSSRDPHTHWRSFNHYTSIDQHITVELGTLFTLFNKNYNDNVLLHIVGGIYAGVGIGLINNDVKKIVNVPTADELPGNTGLTNPVLLKNSTGFFIPISVGYNLHIRRFWFLHNGFVLNANFQYEDCQTDYVDGYSPPFATNKKNDVFTVMSLGLRFYLTHHHKQED